MKRKPFAKIMVALMAVVLVFVSVISVPTDVQAAVKPTKITLKDTKKTIYVGEKYTISIKSVTPKKASKSVSYKSSNTKVATVDARGKVTAKSKGTATITVTSKLNSKVKATCRITVKQQVKTITVTNAVNKTVAVVKGKSLQLKASVAPANANDKKLTYTSKDKKIATVTSGGKITGKKAGKTTITIKSKDGKASTKITVIVPKVRVTKVTLKAQPNVKKLDVGKTVKLTATVAPSNASVKTVSYKSNNTKVATVDTKGTVKAIAPGTAKITATTLDGNKTATYTITVNPIKVTSITLSAPKSSLVVGETVTVKATVKPDNATNKAVTWASSNKSAATVDAKSGKVTAVGVGTTKITATAADGSKVVSKAYDITVKAATVPVTGVTVSPKSKTLNVDEKFDLTFTVAPSNATNKNVSWSTNNPAVATVDSNGKVTAVGAGNAIITVKTADGNKTDTCAITVTVPVTDITLDKETATLKLNATLQLEATVLPETATNKAVTWESSNKAIATVADGLVTPLKAGETTITVTTADGEFTASCVVTVVDQVNVLLNPDGPELIYSFDKTASYIKAVKDDKNLVVDLEDILADEDRFIQELADTNWNNDTLKNNWSKISVEALKDNSNVFSSLLFQILDLSGDIDMTLKHEPEDTIKLHVEKGSNVRDLTIVRTDAAVGSNVTITDENTGKVMTIADITVKKMSTEYVFTAKIQTAGYADINVKAHLALDGKSFVLNEDVAGTENKIFAYTSTADNYTVKINTTYYLKLVDMLNITNVINSINIYNVYAAPENN